MKKILLLLIVVSNHHLTHSQTKQETADWLTGKLNEYSKVNDGINNETFCYIKDGNIFEKTYNKTFNSNTIFGIPIKSVKKIIIYKDKVSFHFNLVCESNCVNEQINNAVGKIEENTIKMLELEINNEDSTLYDRIPKSLVHLIKLYGGNPKLVFYKEPF